MTNPKIVVSGAAAGKASEEGAPIAYAVGQAIARREGILLTGATSGVPLEAARGAKSKRGHVIGFSPARSLLEHQKKYRLPVDYHDQIFYTGYDYAGRDVLLVDVSDAVISVSGRIGSLHEFTQAFERRKVIGLVLGSGGIIDEIPDILQRAGRGFGRVVMDEDPDIVVQMVYKQLELDAKRK